MLVHWSSSVLPVYQEILIHQQCTSGVPVLHSAPFYDVPGPTQEKKKKKKIAALTRRLEIRSKKDQQEDLWNMPNGRHSQRPVDTQNPATAP